MLRQVKPVIKFSLLILATAALFHLLTVPQAGAESAAVRMIPEGFSSLAKQISPAVVNIRTVKTIKGGGRVFRHFRREPFGRDDQFRDFFEKFFGEENQRDFKQRSLGSGFIIDREGYIVTNNHVIEDADRIKVILKDEKEFDAEIVGRDPNTDIALIKIDAESAFVEVKFGDSDRLEVGQWVVAIGSPFGLEQTVTAGIVSAKGRVLGSGPYDDFIQTDASINPGNSGGPLINMKGEVVGINTAIIASAQGLGFAIPINLAKGIIDQLKESGEVTRGWLGVSIQSLSQELREYYRVENGTGVLVVQVFKGDPADKAGIEPQDIILEVNGKKVKTKQDVTRMIADIGVGETAKIRILRNGREKTFTVKIAKRDEDKIASKDRRDPQENELGITVSEITPELSRRFNIMERDGVIVISVENGSKAEEADIQHGDIIKEINHEPIKDKEDFNAAVEKAREGDSLKLFIKRRNMGFIVRKIEK
jgi:serine protease Do